MNALLVLVFGWILVAPSWANDPPRDPGAIRVVKDPGKFHGGHDPAWADPAFDDSGWRPAVMARGWSLWCPELVDDPQGWYRLRVDVRPDRPISLINKHIHGAAEVYVDGRLLHTAGDVERGRHERHAPIILEVPRELTADGELVIATRVANFSAPAPQGYILSWAVTHPEAAAHYLRRETHAQWISPGGLIQTLVCAGLLGLGLLHGFLWLRRREPSEGFFALGTALLGLFVGSDSLIKMDELTPTTLYEATRYSRLYLPYLSLLWFAHLFLGTRGRPAMIAITAWVLLAVTVLLFGENLPGRSYLTGTTTGTQAIAGIVILADGVRRRIPYARLLVAGFLPLTVIGLFDAANGLGLQAVLGESASRVYHIRNLGFNVSYVVILTTMSFALISRFADTLDEIGRTVRATARFVPDQFLALLGHRRITEVRRGDSASRDVTVMFCAIPGFTRMSEGWAAEQSFAFLNRFLEAMEPHIHDNGGFVAQYLGDGFLAMFPVGSSSPVSAAVALQAAARALKPEPGHERIQVAIGLHTGPVMLGTVGSEERLTTGQVSDVVNTSSRVKGLTAHYGAPIVISESTRALVDGDGWALHELDAVVMKGKAAPVRAFEVLSGEPDPVLRRFKESEAAVYDEGLAAFRAGHLERARPLFARLADRWVAARLFVQRCDWFLANGLPDDWDGVVRLTVK